MNQPWPKLDYESYKETLQVVHLWTQIIGKIRLRKMPWLNHSWHVSLYVSPRGFTTGSIPFEKGLFEIEFDFLNHLLHFRTSAADGSKMSLQSETVAEFHQKVFDQLDQLGVPVNIYAAPNEMEPAIPFAEDHRPQVYQPEEMNKLWQAFMSVHKVFFKVQGWVCRKMQPGASFLGCLRPGSNPFLRTHSTSSSGRYAKYPIRGNARSIFA